MAAKFDVFTRLPDGHPLWVDSFESLEQARQHLKDVARDAISDCFIYSEATGIVETVHGEATLKTPST